MRPHLLLIPALMIGTLPALADELPRRKAGLWELKMIAAGRELPLRSIRQCTDAETDALMTTSFDGMSGHKCDKIAVSNNGGTVTVDSTCKIGSAVRTTRAVITGDFDSAYTVSVTSMPAAAAAPETGSAGQSSMTMEAKWLGPCQQGQRPGDIILPGGIRLNVRNLAIEPGGPRR